MPYTDSSGVQIPVGTDAFNPTAQFATWQNGNATYNNRVIVPLDTDRTALASPVLRKGLRCYVEATDLEWVYTGTVWVQAFPLTNLQLGTTNSTARTETQYGVTKITGAATNLIWGTVTFPVPFASIPIIHTSMMGTRAAGAFNLANLIVSSASLPSSYDTTTTNTVIASRNTAGNYSASFDTYVAWSATGVLA